MSAKRMSAEDREALLKERLRRFANDVAGCGCWGGKEDERLVGDMVREIERIVGCEAHD